MKSLSKLPSTWRWAALWLGVFALRWHLLQGIAWSSMLVRYSLRHGPLEGWQRTFDGDHPCAICHAVAAGGRAEALLLGTLAEHPSLVMVPVVLATGLLAPLRRTLRPATA
jgi:hypothetical protein